MEVSTVGRRPRRALGRARRALRGAISDLGHRLRLRRLARARPEPYRAYLREQLERTLSKRANDPGIGARVLIERAVAVVPPQPGAAVLCVGCRNPIELDEFRARGYTDVVGIDLFSQRDDILVMDMHDMAFPDDRFDVVYASHSLEHAYDVAQALAEIGRVGRPGAAVAIEVPVRHKGSDADRLELAGLAELRRLVEPYGRVVWADEQPARSPTNDQGSAVARVVLRLSEREGA